jgi:hypothetical protein
MEVAAARNIAKVTDMGADLIIVARVDSLQPCQPRDWNKFVTFFNHADSSDENVLP